MQDRSRKGFTKCKTKMEVDPAATTRLLDYFSLDCNTVKKYTRNLRR